MRPTKEESELMSKLHVPYVKPVLTIRLPSGISMDQAVAVIKDFDKRTELHNDYHVIIYIGNQEDVGFQALFSQDATNVDFEDLKRTVLNSLTKIIDYEIPED